MFELRTKSIYLKRNNWGRSKVGIYIDLQLVFFFTFQSRKRKWIESPDIKEKTSNCIPFSSHWTPQYWKFKWCLSSKCNYRMSEQLESFTMFKIQRTRVWLFSLFIFIARSITIALLNLDSFFFVVTWNVLSNSMSLKDIYLNTLNCSVFHRWYGWNVHFHFHLYHNQNLLLRFFVWIIP